MIILRQGDRAPIVAACQLLLNAYRLRPVPISIDGAFGPATNAAAIEFQRQNGLAQTGTIEQTTFGELKQSNGLEVHDSIDVFDPLLLQSRAVLEDAGAQASLLGGMCDGIAGFRAQLAQRRIGNGRLLLLRFHGHGNRGVQIIAHGTSAQVYFEVIRGEAMPSTAVPTPGEDDPDYILMRRETLYSQIGLRSLTHARVADALRSLRPLFHPAGSVEFHGCQVGGGIEGRRFLRQVADLVGVPAVAARRPQLTTNAVRYGGPIEIQMPGGRSLARWGASRAPLDACG